MKKLILLSLIILLSVVFTGCSLIKEVPCFDENISNITNNSISDSLNMCTMDYMPVCGIDGMTYSNYCTAGNMTIAHEGVCECFDSTKNISLTENEARVIADLDADCEGHLMTNGFCNSVTGTWWFETNIEKEGCNPACVVKVSNEEVEINWMCTGLVPIKPTTKYVCSEDEKNAEICTMEYAPVCGSNDVTYSNGCSACGSGLEFWIEGEC